MEVMESSYCRLHGNKEKLPIDIDNMIYEIRKAVRQFPKAAMFELAERGYMSPFEQLIGCIISTQTFDEVTIPTAIRLFEAAGTPQEMSKLSPHIINGLIHACTFHEVKSKQIHEIARRIMEVYGGELPCDGAVIRSFAGVGLKCANLVLGIACNQPRVSADIHVHRVTNRWGYVRTRTPEDTSVELEQELPRQYWVEINKLLVPFGKHICTGKLPHCSACPVLNMCRQVGVAAHR